MREVKNITDSNFQNDVLDVDKIILVDFWAPWCGPCKTVSPIIDEIAGEEENAYFGKLNVDENPLTAAKYAIMSIPTLAIFKNGEMIDKLIGAHPKEVIESHLRKALDG